MIGDWWTEPGDGTSAPWWAKVKVDNDVMGITQVFPALDRTQAVRIAKAQAERIKAAGGMVAIMKTHVFNPIGQCTGKNRYSTKGDARYQARLAEEHGFGRQQVYLCPHCSTDEQPSYHTGHKPPRRRGRTP